MLSVYFDGLESRLISGMEEFSREYGFSISSECENSDLKISICKTDEKKLVIERNDKKVNIFYNSPSHIFRATSLVLQNIDDKNYKVNDTVYFDDTIVMLDVCQGGALLRPKHIFKMLKIFAAMGFSAFMVYLEDNYVIKDVPGFGYMRPKYSYEDLKAIDDYAYSLGIEAIPCMQTLGHLPHLLKWHSFDAIKDGDTTLLVGEEETYKFIRKMLEASSKPFRTSRIHIGMDEAWGLGLGQYLSKNGYTEKSKILRCHLDNVSKILDEMNLKPMMWGDMFFRAASKDEVYLTDKEVEFSDEIINSIPKNMDIVYWDYASEEAQFKNMLKQNKKLGKDIIYSGSVRNHLSFACKHTINTTMANRTLPICKDEGIRRFIATVWQDNCPESFTYGALLGLGLYAEHIFAKEVDKDKWYKRFKFFAKCDAEPFEALELFDKIPNFTEKDTSEYLNASKCLLWQDVMLGVFDKDVDLSYDLEKHYNDLGDFLTHYASKNQSFSDLFNYYASAAYAISKKAMLGIKIREAYSKNDKQMLLKAKNDIEDALEKVKTLHNNHKKMWFEICNPVGWEVLDIRYGALIARLTTAKERVLDYIDGKTENILELEEHQMNYYGVYGWTCEYEYTRLSTASKL